MYAKRSRSRKRAALDTKVLGDCPASQSPHATAQYGCTDITGVEIVEYTVGVEGCGRRITQVVACAVDGTGCYYGVRGP